MNFGSDTGNVYSIAADRPFVDDLATAIMAQVGDDPIALATYRILLPTRRACRSLREAFLRIGGGAPRLLPRMTPIGDVDEDDLILEIEGSIGGIMPDLPPAISGLRRQLILTRLVQARDPDARPEQCALLAQELARLIDQVATERLEFSDLPALAEEKYASHWQDILKFLEIVTESWPAILAEEGVIDPAERRNRLLAAQSELWQRQPPDFPVIAAGSTGSIPATADLLATVASLPSGTVVLPGLDQDLHEDAWRELGEGHPQSGLARLLRRLNIKREDVASWPLPDPTADRRHDRARLLSRALIPANAIHTPVSNDDLSDLALEGVTRIDCPDPVREAEAIALIMRESLEQPTKTAALVTPDRSLARRVAAELRRWHIDIDDSAGQPLAQTPPGVFMRLSCELLTGQFDPVTLLSLLKHPLAAGGIDSGHFRRLTRRLEKRTLRGPRPAQGWSGLMALLDDKDIELAAWIEQLDERTQPLTRLAAMERAPLSALVRAHVEVAENLTATNETAGAAVLWAGEAGESLSGFLAELAENADRLADLDPRTYAPLFETLMQGRAVRPKYGRHPRLNIWGPLEARLQHADIMILGGLNEGSWPLDPEPGPWMSRPMMADFGLPPPERRIGLSAHDFTQAFAAPEIVLTRAARADGAPTVATRWLQRLQVQIEGTSLAKAFKPDTRYLALAASLDRPDPKDIVAPTPPAPTPPVEHRPGHLSVTRIETWLRDPYAIYARYMLDLEPLEPVDAAPTAAERGTLIHDALETFLKAHQGDLPDNAEQRLIAVGEKVFAPHLDREGVRTFWWPRFLRIAHWFINNEHRWRERGWTPWIIESRGEMAVDDNFRLTGKADRIDRLPDGKLAIIDYKTGQPPGIKEVKVGLAPQLPLEAAMASAGAFPEMNGESFETARLEYWHLSGGRDPGKTREVSTDTDATVLGEEALDNLRGYINLFRQPTHPYVSRRRPKRHDLVGDYDHLARVREWARGDDGGNDSGDGGST